MTKPLVSIVCPVFNEERSIGLFHQRLMSALAASRAEYDFELIFTNNRSTDGTSAAVLALRAQDPSIQLLTFSRNWGYQSSVLAGLRQASGDAVIVIDVDCEDPPEMIPRFLAGWREGFDVVYGERGRRQEPLPVTWARKIFYRLNRLVADSDIVLDMAEFSLMSAAVRDAVVCSTSTYPFLRAEIGRYGFSRKAIAYDREKRVAGETHYNLMGMTRFAVAGILSSTTLPLRMALYLVPLLAVVNAALLGVEMAGLWNWGFKVMVAVDFLYVATIMAFLALYLARTYHNVIARPLVVIDWARSAVNAPAPNSPNALPRRGPVLP